MKKAAGALGLVFGCVAIALVACSSPSESTVTITAPDRATFDPVSDYLEHRCGSLDCHGIAQRNLRLYGNEGLRLDPNARPSSQPNTTTAERDQNFISVVGLEPESMSTVVNEQGANPLRLALLRKPMGIENHKGGALIQMNDAQYTCIASWLAGSTDTTACASAKAVYP